MHFLSMFTKFIILLFVLGKHTMTNTPGVKHYFHIEPREYTVKESKKKQRKKR